MTSNKVYRAIGLMSGTSLDGEIDVALIETDGRDFVRALDFSPQPYDSAVREAVRACFGKRAVDADTRAAEELVTRAHIEAVKASGFQADVIGFHGQTITHAPEERFTWQLGDGAALAQATGMDVVADFRSADVAAGGQGAPLAPLYHRAIMAERAGEGSLAVLNLGGVANVTYINNVPPPLREGVRGRVPDLNGEIQHPHPDPPPSGGGNNLETGEIIAFDCGPANALMDDYMKRHSGRDYDADGALAGSGRADEAAVSTFLSHVFFAAKPPKSLDRNHFEAVLASLPAAPADAMATLLEISAAAVAAALEHFPAAPNVWYACGGGRHNKALMSALSRRLAPARVEQIEAAGWNGDAIEAQCFAYLAVRSVLGEPLSLPMTTGVPAPMTGGVLYKAG